ncbi:hypothetical protein ACFLZT_04040 [Thermodesulfobacteriota bacterium]
MKNGKKSLVLGIVIGLILAIFYFQFFAPRYETKKLGVTLVKTDKWTGQSWRFVDNAWKRMLNMDEDYEKVDQTLREALNVPLAQVDTGSALDQLREKYPILTDLPEDELLERIKLVYSKMVLVTLYLNDFMTKGEGSKENAAENEVTN